jgi:hypothetical protein
MSVVDVELTRYDLLVVTMRVSVRHSSTWIGWLVLAALVAAVVLFKNGIPDTPRNSIALVLASAGGATAGIAIGFLFSTISIIFGSKQWHGVLGRHTYTLRESGLLEQTQANETLVKWGGAQELRRTRDYLLIETGPALFHVIPRRSFASDADFEAFWSSIQRLRAGDV